MPGTSWLMVTTALLGPNASSSVLYNRTDASWLMLLVASSKKRNLGDRRMMCAMTARCCSPPDNTLDQSAVVSRPATTAAEVMSNATWDPPSCSTPPFWSATLSAATGSLSCDVLVTRCAKPTSCSTCSTLSSLYVPGSSG
mmetsp:Transcript_54452/g.152951  ORF Transcript_54452/g.152951 Transcript_54452/m.152951 type:complete len:141 (+) Transcript_54452:375-797(+)